MKITRKLQHSSLLTGILITCLATFFSHSVSAITIQSAKIMGDVVKVKGTGAVPYAMLYWDLSVPMVEVAQADAHGRFQFTSELVPKPPRCVGFLTDGETEMRVEVDNCRGSLDGFYEAPLDSALVQPGEYGSVRSRCELGDFAVSAGFVTRSLSNDPADFRITVFSKLGDGETGQESWRLQGINAGDNVAEIRVFTTCAKVLPPSGPH